LYNPAPSVVLAASSAGLLRSESGPNGPYAVVLSGMITDLVQHPSTPSVLFCCRSSIDAPDSGGGYRALGGGETWLIQGSTFAPRDSIENAVLAICRNQPQTLLYVYEWKLKFGTDYAAVITGMRISNDGGTSWTPIMPDSIGGQADHALSVAIDPVDPRHLFVGCNQLFESRLGGPPGRWADPVGLAAPPDPTQLLFIPP